MRMGKSQFDLTTFPYDLSSFWSHLRLLRQQHPEALSVLPQIMWNLHSWAGLASCPSATKRTRQQCGFTVDLKISGTNRLALGWNPMPDFAHLCTRPTLIFSWFLSQLQVCLECSDYKYLSHRGECVSTCQEGYYAEGRTCSGKCWAILSVNDLIIPEGGPR